MNERNSRHSFDPAAFEQLLGSEDPALLAPLFERALSSLSEFAGNRSIQMSSLEFDAHKLKNTTLQLGLEQLTHILEAIETAAKNNREERCQALMRIFNSEYDLVSECLEQYAEQLRSKL